MNNNVLAQISKSLGLYIVLFLLFSCASSSTGPRSSLAEMPDLESRADEADIIVVCELGNVRSSPYIKGAESVQVQLEVVEYLKGRTTSPINLSFLVFPYSVENHMTRAPKAGRYIVFLKWQQVEDKDGKKGDALVLIDPKPFSLVFFSESRLREVKDILNVP